jgi:hypothetical protein
MVDRAANPVAYTDLINWETSVRCLGGHPDSKVERDVAPTGFSRTHRITVEYHQHRIVYDIGEKDGFFELIRIDDIKHVIAPCDLKNAWSGKPFEYVKALFTILIEQGKKIYLDHLLRDYPNGEQLVKTIRRNAENNLAEWYGKNKVSGQIPVVVADNDDNEEHKAMIKNVNLILDQANVTQKRSDEELKRQRIELAELEKQPDRAIECVICMDRIPSISLIPCGHIFCKDCIDCLAKKECPTCKQLFQSTLKLYGLTK